METPKRKGSRSIKEIPPEILRQLNHGEIESANLVEYIGTDRKVLLEQVLTQFGRREYLPPVLARIDGLEKHTVVTISAAIGTGLYEQISARHDDELLSALATHPSDMVRCWASHVTGKNTQLDIAQMLAAIRPFAADSHFNVRECAWGDVRSNIIENLPESLSLLTGWAKDPDENIRRFASEATRPRGVWCPHIEPLKQAPALGLPLLEPLKSDSSKYVRDSVGNWLNDASKTQPRFVEELCGRWQQESPTSETSYILKKALRTIEKSRGKT